VYLGVDGSAAVARYILFRRFIHKTVKCLELAILVLGHLEEDETLLKKCNA
jgi:hypothetical protein